VIVFVGKQPVSHPTELGAIKTMHTSESWELWRWTPRTQPEVGYHYILMANDGTDPILYQRSEPGECRGDTRSESKAG
jgi:hypothetical protein